MSPPLSLPPLLATNLRALARSDGRLAARLCLPAENDHLVGDPLHLRHHRATYPLSLSDEKVAACTAAASGLTHVLGIGLGELVDACLERGCTVVAWERDPSLLRAALERCDWSEPIQTGRLRLALGVDLIDLVDTAVESTVEHPLLCQLYRLNLGILSAPMGARRALICTGGLFVDDVADALIQDGFTVYPWDIHRLSEQELDKVVTRFDPELIFAINHTHGLAEACHRLGRPLVVWEIDPATDDLRRCGTPTGDVAVYTYREAHISRFRQAGFRHVAPMPLASNTNRRVPATATTPPDPDASEALCFVGASMVDQAQRFQQRFLEAWVRFRGGDPSTRAEGAARLDGVLAEQRRRGGDFAIPALMRDQMGDFLLATHTLLRDDPVAMVAEMSAAERRLNVVGALGHLGIRVWGDAGWKATVRTGARYMGFAGHDRALTAIYQSGRVHMDVGRIYQQDIVPMRVFDILACGGFLIAEHSEALTALFVPGTHLETWRTVDELRAKAEHYMHHPEAAREIAQQGLALVRAEHSIAQRVQTMIAHLTIDVPSTRSVV